VLSEITPLILTHNEAPNIGRTLQELTWARDIVVVDSFSTDNTLDIVRRMPQARIFQRVFDCHEQQWNYALSQTGISTVWVLALDADYVLSAGIVSEIAGLTPRANVAGYRARFEYCIHGHTLRASAYPPVTVLYRRCDAGYRQDGHTQRIVVAGDIADLSQPIRHDDRKPISQWIRSQDRYSELETMKMLEPAASVRTMADRIRRLRVVSPFLVFFYCLLVKRTVLDGWPGVYYAFQRMIAEALLSLRLIESHILGPREDPASEWIRQRSARR
jgi:glycosyltransferase involved in cell wall biosynthesis